MQMESVLGGNHPLQPLRRQGVTPMQIAFNYAVDIATIIYMVVGVVLGIKNR